MLKGVRSMKILAVDTATSCQSVAILEGKSVLAHVEQDAQGSHAKWLVLSIDAALRAAGLRLHEMNGLAVSIGPGSFTGLRVGLATLLGFRTALGIPLVAVPTLEAMAWNVRTTEGTVCPILKSRKHEIYWAMYQWMSDHRLHRLVSEQIGAPESLARSIDAPLTAFGDGWVANAQEIRDCLGSRATLIREAAPTTATRPLAISVGLAAGRRFASGQIEGIGVAPLYVQRSEAEMKYEERGGISPGERLKQRVAKRTQRKEGRPPVDRKRQGAA